MKEIRENHMNDSIKVIALGSSMSLNNLHTKTIREKIDQRYLNISSWGQTIEEDYFLLQLFTKYFNPNRLLISSNFMDFNSSPKKINYHLTEEYLTDNSQLNIDWIKFNDLFTYFEYRYLNKHDYSSLQYDESGGINFSKEKFNISRERWQGYHIKTIKPDNPNYLYLDSIAHFCKEKGIKFTFILSPLRTGYYSKLDGKSLIDLYQHKTKVRMIMEKNDQLFVDTHDKSWSDSLFIDYSHLNSDGAEKLTQLLIGKIKDQEYKN